VLAGFLFAAGSSHAGGRRAYEHDATGNLKRVLDVTTDNANCGAIGTVCAGTSPCCDGTCCPGYCQAAGCCNPTTCAPYLTCGTQADGCGNTLTCGTCPGGKKCAGQTCFFDQTTGHAEPDVANGSLTVLAGQFDVEVSAQFVSSKGAYASALSFSPRAAVASTCGINGGLGDCVFYTAECAGLGGNKCPPDANAGPGEISCWCKPPRKMKFQNIAKGGVAAFSSSLFIDKNVDGTSEETRMSSARIGDANKGSVRYYQVIPTVWRTEWEDLNAAPNGDYNDYVGAISFKDCDDTPFPPPVVSWPEVGLTCLDGCSETACSDSSVSKPTDLRLAAKVMIDDEIAERSREARGRLLTLSLLAESMNMQQMAFCPVIWFKYEKTWDCNSTFAADRIQLQEYAPPGTATCSFGLPTPGPNQA